MSRMVIVQFVLPANCLCGMYALFLFMDTPKYVTFLLSAWQGGSAQNRLLEDGGGLSKFKGAGYSSLRPVFGILLASIPACTRFYVVRL